jgi:alpha-methylacyl-CoA racemase
MGPLHGIRVIELAGLGPAPFCAMVLADLGAEVLRIDRTAPDPVTLALRDDVVGRGRRSVAVDLKHPDGPGVVLRLAATADVLIEGFRPGVAERLGIGPDACRHRNPRLVYGRMTGWGQDGPLAGEVGHDIDYIALTGALHAVGPADRPPPPPLNLVGDYGGGGMLLALGVLAALVERERSGEGQVIDAAMTDGSALLTAMFHGMAHRGLWREGRGSNLLDGAAPFYRCYQCADGGYVAVGALEPRFYAALLEGLGLEHLGITPQYDTTAWPQLAQRFATVFATRTRDEWATHFAGTEACVAPVLSFAEAPDHPHNRARGTFVDVGGVVQPAPAPRFSRTAPPPPSPPPAAGADTDALAGWGFEAAEITRLREAGAVE